MTHEIELTYKFQLTDENIRDLIITAFEGGINYWCSGVVESYGDGGPHTSKYDVIPNNGILILGDDIEGRWVALTLPGLLNGIKMFCNLRGTTPANYFDSDYGDYDADDADGMIQFAVFGEWVYG
jgi:hypothetical protein